MSEGRGFGNLRLVKSCRIGVLSVVLAVAGSAAADDASRAISGPFTVAYLAAGLGLPLLQDHEAGRERSFRTLDTLLVTFGLTEGFKGLIHETRPDGSDRQSFPSEHTSLAFAVATMQAQYHPDEAIYWYGGATLIGASRVWDRKHYWHDVLAGAALGYGVARLELSMPHGLILQPLIGAHGETGVMIAGRF